MAADHSIVLTTCEPASYLDAYRFMKISLYLKLNRLFSPESRYDMRKDPELVRLIAESTMAADGNNVENIDELLGRVKRQLPHRLGLVNRAVTSFEHGDMLSWNIFTLSSQVRLMSLANSVTVRCHSG